MELDKLKDEILALRKNTGEATDQKNTWATKYEALERNFKQVSELLSAVLLVVECSFTYSTPQMPHCVRPQRLPESHVYWIGVGRLAGF